MAAQAPFMFGCDAGRRADGCRQKHLTPWARGGKTLAVSFGFLSHVQSSI